MKYFCQIILILGWFIYKMKQSVIGGQYKLIKLIQKGKHSQVYHCISIKTGLEHAIKIQPPDSSSLLRQGNMLTCIQADNNMIMDYGLPLCYHTEKTQSFNAVVQTLLGNNLKELLKKCKGVLKISTFLMVADQMLKRLEFLHSKDYIHRSISLKKWAIGNNKSSKTLYLIGFGKCKHYCKNNNHITYAEQKPLLNDPMYASINNHLGIQPSRRDDLESMLYCWASMLYGKLPWQFQNQNDKILSRKIEQRSEVLFASFPQPLIDIGKHIQELSFGQDPDYQYMRNKLFELYAHYNLEFSYNYDWQQQILKI